MNRGARGAVGPVAVAVLAALALAPVLLERGFVLIGDMSFVPEQPPKAAWWGLDGSVPRAVPADGFVSAASHVLPGDLVQKVVLLGALVLAGLGMHALVRSLLVPTARWAPLGAAVLYLWNPWVLERLAIGHWGLLLGYAALPWVAHAAIGYRRCPGPRQLAAVVVPFALAAFGSPTGGLLAAAVVLVLALDRAAPRAGAAVIGAVVVLDLPWLLPGVLGAAEPTDVAGVGAFAARADTPYGVLGSVLSLGGIWKEAVVPDDRGSVLLAGVALVISLVALVFLTRQPRLLALAVVGLLLAVLPTFGAGSELVEWLVRNVPGAGILRDSQKWLALLALGVGVGFGLALDAAVRAVHRARVPLRWLVAAVSLSPVVLLPSFAWGIAGKLDPVQYPAEWSRVRQVLDDQPASERRIVVLPFSAYQAFGWNGGVAALDPAIRFFPGDVVTNDALVIDGGPVVAGEDPAAAPIAAAIAAGDPLLPVLREQQVRYVLVERSAAGGARIDDTGLAAAGRILVDGTELRLIDLGSGSAAGTAAYAPVVVAGDVLALGSTLGAVVLLSVRQIGGKRDKTR